NRSHAFPRAEICTRSRSIPSSVKTLPSGRVACCTRSVLTNNRASSSMAPMPPATTQTHHFFCCLLIQVLVVCEIGAICGSFFVIFAFFMSRRRLGEGGCG